MGRNMRPAKQGGAAGGNFPPAVAAGASPSSLTSPTVGPARQGSAFHEIDGVDARERADRYVRPRSPDWINDVVGLAMYILNGGWNDWILPSTRRTFSVTRWYRHRNVAVDFPRNEAEAARCDEKRDVLAGLGIAYVAILPGETITPDQLQDRIAAARSAVVRRLPARTPEPALAGAA